MLEFITNMTAGELAGAGALALAALSTAVEIAPIRINPWSALAAWLGRAINGEVIDRVTSLGEKVDRLEADIMTNRAAEEARDAESARSRILRFGDECLHDQRHSKEHFDQIMRDIKKYETYCKEHPEFENNTAVYTIKHIGEIYQKRLKDHSFL